MRRMGFGPRFCELVAILLFTPNKGDAQWRTRPSILHRRGLKQGDPLSPIFFVLIMNTLSKALAKAIELWVLKRLVRQEPTTSVSLYADDVVIFCHLVDSDFHAVRGILEVFGHAS